MTIILLRRVWGWTRKDLNSVVKIRYYSAVLRIELQTMRIESCIAHVDILISYTTNIKHTNKILNNK